MTDTPDIAIWKGRLALLSRITAQARLMAQTGKTAQDIVDWLYVNQESLINGAPKRIRHATPKPAPVQTSLIGEQP